MDREILLEQAKTIADKLDDQNAVWFHYKSVKTLGFDKCYELCSLALEKATYGNLRTSPARYYNGCVMGEVKKQGLIWL